jgi:hypothetical protein
MRDRTDAVLATSGRRGDSRQPTNKEILSHVNMLDEFVAEQLAELSGLGMIDAVQPLLHDRWLLDRRLQGPTPGMERAAFRELLLVDRSLQPVWRLLPPPEPPFWYGGHAVADDLSLAALALPREVRLVDREGGLVALFPYRAERGTGAQAVSGLPDAGLGEAGGCAFSADGRWLWACVPQVEADQRAWDELWLIDLANQRIMNRRPLDFYAQIVSLWRHPDMRTVRVSLGYGLESAEHWARAVDGRIELWGHPGSDRLGGAHPSGSEYLTTPEEDGPEELVRRRWPDGTALARLPVVAVGLPEGSWTAATYLTDELLLATVRQPAENGEKHLLLARAPLRPLGWVRYPGRGTPPGGLGPSGDGAWLTVDSVHGNVARWTLARTRDLADRRGA